MNAYTTTSQARIQPHDFSAVLRANGLAGTSLARLEWQRGCQAEAELVWRLKQNGRKSNSSGSLDSLRQTIGAALVRAGNRLTGVPKSGVSPNTSPAGTLGMVG